MQQQHHLADCRSALKALAGCRPKIALPLWSLKTEKGLALAAET
jgi:hypothetical protein